MTDNIDVPTRALSLSLDWPAEGLQSVLRTLPEWQPSVADDIRAATTRCVEQAAADVCPLLTATQYLVYFLTGGRRNGLVSGCFPPDPFYKRHWDRAERAKVKAAKWNDPG